MGSKKIVEISMKKVWRVQALTQALRVAYRDLAKDLQALEEIRKAQDEARGALAAIEADQQVSDVVLMLRRWEKAATVGRHVVFTSRGPEVREGRVS